jgi:hypothetical protein
MTRQNSLDLRFDRRDRHGMEWNDRAVRNSTQIISKRRQPTAPQRGPPYLAPLSTSN